MARGTKPSGEGTSRRQGTAAHRGPTRPSPADPADAILIGDTHFMTRQPKCRTDDFMGAMIVKLAAVVALQAEHNDCPVLHSGDVFDEWFLHKGEQWLMTALISVISNWICVPGQHDLPQHSLELYGKSNLAVLEEAGCVDVFTRSELIPLNIDDKFWLLGFPWGDGPARFPIPGTDPRPKAAIVHRMTYPGKPPYPGAENTGGTARALMQKMKGFDLIVTGDNHETFVAGLEKGTKEFCRVTDWEADKNFEEFAKQYNLIWEMESLLVNPGSMMRLTAAQADHEPCVFLWWAADNRVERVVLPHEKGVVSRDHIERKQERDERIAAWVERIGEGDVDLELGFKENLERHMKKHKVPDAVQDVIRGVL